MYGMSRNGPDKWSGRFYNVDDGKTYDGNLVVTGAGKPEGRRLPDGNLPGRELASRGDVGAAREAVGEAAPQDLTIVAAEEGHLSALRPSDIVWLARRGRATSQGAPPC